MNTYLSRAQTFPPHMPIEVFNSVQISLGKPPRISSSQVRRSKDIVSVFSAINTDLGTLHVCLLTFGP